MIYLKCNRPRVLLLAEYSLFGGTRTYAKQLVSFYSRNHFDVTVLAMSPHDDRDMVLYCQANSVRLLCYEDVSMGLSDRARMPWPLRKERSRLNAFIAEFNPDIIVASVGTPGLFLRNLCCSRPSIYILHTYPGLPRSRLLYFVKKLIWTAIVPRDIQFVTVSQYARNRILQAWGLWLRKHEICIIYSTAGCIEPYQWNEPESIRLLTVGHVVDYKNPFMWIDGARMALDVLPSLSFVWVGPGPLINACKRRVDELGLQTKIKFVGESADVDLYYKACHVYVQPSKIESLGLSVLDAMRYGKPCVVSKVGGLTELIRDGETGWLVESGDPHELARRITQLACDMSMLERMGRNAQKIYAMHFSSEMWESKIKRLHQMV
jgi:glycosyltransferase involved in cell wall biosynthesis